MDELAEPEDLTPEQRRDAAITRFQWGAGSYVLVNAGLVLIWLVAGGPFWPIWPIVIWGLIVVGDAVKTFNTDYGD